MNDIFKTKPDGSLIKLGKCNKRYLYNKEQKEYRRIQETAQFKDRLLTKFYKK